MNFSENSFNAVSTQEDAMENDTLEIRSDQFEEFVKLLRENFIAAGIADEIVDDVIIRSSKMLKDTHTPQNIFTHGANRPSLNDDENRGIDCLGRILVEYTFCRTPETQMICPDNSEQDQSARKMFIPTCVPRPLMRYFLASVRGSIPALDNFEAKSMLANDTNNTHEKRTQRIAEIIKEFEGPFGSGENSINWQAVYADIRFQQLARELIGDILRTIEQLKLETYLQILQDFSQNDSDNTGINAMQRSFSLKDAQQIVDALMVAEKALA